MKDWTEDTAILLQGLSALTTLGFMVEQEAKGNSKATLDYYRRFFKKRKAFTATLEQDGAETLWSFWKWTAYRTPLSYP